jgi:hypothetical protein
MTNWMSIVSSVKKYSPGLLILAIIMLFSGCLEKDPCNGLEPVVIDYNEPYILKLRTEGDTSIFTSMYDINNLVIVENGDTLAYKYFRVSTDSVIKFTPKSLSAAYIWRNFDSIMNTELIFRYDSIHSDTMFIMAQPKHYETACPKTEFHKIELKFNDRIIRSRNNTTCITCSDTLVIKI